MEKKQVVMTQEITTGKSYTQDDTGYAWCPAMYETCHLTTSDFSAIKSAIAGEGFFNRLMTVGEAIEEYGSRSNPQIDGLSGTGE